MDLCFSNESSNAYNSNNVIDVVLSDDNDNNSNIVIKNSMSNENDGIDTVPVNTAGFFVHQMRKWKEAYRRSWFSKKSSASSDDSHDTNNGYWKILMAGQTLSFLLASTGAASATLHFECNLSAPTAQMGLVYLLLSLRAPFRFKKPSNNATTAADDDCDGNGENCRLLQRLMSWCFRLKQNSGLSWYAYPWIALLDVEANYFTFLAFRYTTLNSVSIFDALAIPSAMIASRFILRTHYQRCHLMGAWICMVGVTLNVLRDYFSSSSSEVSSYKLQEEYPHQMLGDMFAILGALLHGVRDVITEQTLHQLEAATPTHSGNGNHNDKQKESIQNTNEYLGMIGVYGTFISIFQSLLLEQTVILEFFRRTPQVVAVMGAGSNSTTAYMLQRLLVGDEATPYNNNNEYNSSYYFPTDDDDGFITKYTSVGIQTCTGSSGLWLLLAYVLATYFTYVGTSRFLIVSEAALLNLNLLTGDLWAVFFSVIAEHIIPSPLFWICLFLIMSGVLIYEIGPSPTSHSLQKNNENKHHLPNKKNTYGSIDASEVILLV